MSLGLRVIGFAIGMFVSGFLLQNRVWAGNGGSQCVANFSGNPGLVRFNGRLENWEGKSSPGLIGILFALYEDENGGAPLWVESQNVEVDPTGRYSVLLGSEHAAGIPSDLFLTGKARWLGVLIDGQEESKRVALLSVPYALKALDANTVGGRSPSDFVSVEQLKSLSGPLGAFGDQLRESSGAAAVTLTGKAGAPVDPNNASEPRNKNSIARSAASAPSPRGTFSDVTINTTQQDPLYSLEVGTSGTGPYSHSQMRIGQRNSPGGLVLGSSKADSATLLSGGEVDEYCPSSQRAVTPRGADLHMGGVNYGGIWEFHDWFGETPGQCINRLTNQMVLSHGILQLHNSGPTSPNLTSLDESPNQFTGMYFTSEPAVGFSVKEAGLPSDEWRIYHNLLTPMRDDAIDIGSVSRHAHALFLGNQGIIFGTANAAVQADSSGQLFYGNSNTTNMTFSTAPSGFIQFQNRVSMTSLILNGVDVGAALGAPAPAANLKTTKILPSNVTSSASGAIKINSRAATLLSSSAIASLFILRDVVSGGSALVYVGDAGPPVILNTSGATKFVTGKPSPSQIQVVRENGLALLAGSARDGDSIRFTLVDGS